MGKAVNEAMRDIEKHNPQLSGVLPKTYQLFTSTLLKELFKKVSEIPALWDPACSATLRDRGRRPEGERGQRGRARSVLP